MEKVKWTEFCIGCIKKNECDPETLGYCPAEDECNKEQRSINPYPDCPECKERNHWPKDKPCSPEDGSTCDFARYLQADLRTLRKLQK